MPPDKSAGKPVSFANRWGGRRSKILTIRQWFSGQSVLAGRTVLWKNAMGFAAHNPSPPEALPVHTAPPTAPPTAPQAAPDLELARMVQRITQLPPRSGAQALRDLRTAFPDAPLALRVAALGMLLRY
jgi:hypothetical protein